MAGSEPVDAEGNVLRGGSAQPVRDGWAAWSAWAERTEKRVSGQRKTIDAIVDALENLIVAYNESIASLDREIVALKERAYLPGPGDVWLGRFEYRSGEVVHYKGRNWICRRAGKGEPPDGAAGNWELLAADSPSAAEEAVAPPLRLASSS